MLRQELLGSNRWKTETFWLEQSAEVAVRRQHHQTVPDTWRSSTEGPVIDACNCYRTKNQW